MTSSDGSGTVLSSVMTPRLGDFTLGEFHDVAAECVSTGTYGGCPLAVAIPGLQSVAFPGSRMPVSVTMFFISFADLFDITGYPMRDRHLRVYRKDERGVCVLGTCHPWIRKNGLENELQAEYPARTVLLGVSGEAIWSRKDVGDLCERRVFTLTQNDKTFTTEGMTSGTTFQGLPQNCGSLFEDIGSMEAGTGAHSRIQLRWDALPGTTAAPSSPSRLVGEVTAVLPVVVIRTKSLMDSALLQVEPNIAQTTEETPELF